MVRLRWISLLLLCVFLLTDTTANAASADYFGIHVVDDQTGRGVPLVQLQTNNKVRYYTDSNGYVAFDEPGLMDQKIYFAVASWGYTAPEVGFGSKGVILQTTPGQEAEVKLHRVNIAERLYRLTGQGIYRDTILLGKQAPIAQGLVNGKVMGQDTVETAVYNGKMYWFWGDTDCPFFPLGNFSTSGATSKLPSELNLEKGIDYSYFTNRETGFARGMISVHEKDSLPIWVDGLMVLPDARGRSRMLAHFVRTKNLALVQEGIALFNDDKAEFEQICTYPRHSPLGPGGHPMRATDAGKDYYYFPCTYPIKRVLADYEHAIDVSAYEGFTCLPSGENLSGDHPQVNRDANQQLVWTWQKGAQPIGPAEFESLVKTGAVTAGESPYRMQDDHGKLLNAQNGSVAWNPYLRKWTMLFGQLGGDSNLGEIWFATANSPEGPWQSARKVATHAMKDNNYDFYNPMQHPEFMQEGGRIIYFEGTFVTTFSGNPAPTPRYDYNQILYRVDLSDPRIALPEPPPGLSTTQPESMKN